MKKIFILLILLFAFNLYSQADWEKFTNEYPAFTLSFPGKIEQKNKAVTTDIGISNIITVYSVSSIDSTENYFYLLSYYDFDPGIFSNDSLMTVEEYLTNMVQSIAEENKSKILYNNFVPDKNTPSMIFRIDNDEKSMKGKLIVSGNFIYSLQVFTVRQYSLNKNIDKFINGFYLR